MAITRISSLVFVGDQFTAEMFNERALFNGDLDRGGQVRLGPIGQFSYSSGSYRFEVTPPRIDLKYSGPSVLPEALVDAASIVAAMIQPARGAVTVTGFGMNCDTVFDRASTGVSGVEYCSRLVDPRLSDLSGVTSSEAATKVRFREGAIQFEVRFEPHAVSGGESLFVAVNGHQAVSSGEELNSKIEQGQVQAFREYVEALERRIADIDGSA